MDEADLKAIVYLSAAAQPMTSQTLEALLAQARDLNRANGITGVLLCGPGSFLQYFEGRTRAVHETYARIKASRRHGRIAELMYEPIATRSFADWHMGLAFPTTSEMLSLTTARWLRQQAHPADAGRETLGMALLTELWTRWRHDGPTPAFPSQGSAGEAGPSQNPSA